MNFDNPTRTYPRFRTLEEIWATSAEARSDQRVDDLCEETAGFLRTLDEIRALPEA